MSGTGPPKANALEIPIILTSVLNKPATFNTACNSKKSADIMVNLAVLPAMTSLIILDSILLLLVIKPVTTSTDCSQVFGLCY